MLKALELAKKGLYSTSPNPRVGCVIIKNEVQVGGGWHTKAGEAHAELMALQQAGCQAEGSDLYITLEPCCHQGATPPCTDALIKAKVDRIYVAMLDPNPLVHGKGIAKLKAAGINVESGFLVEEAMKLNKGFINRYTKARPWVRVKIAQSLDGATAFNPPPNHRDNQDRWITGKEAREDVHHWRAQSCAILGGSSSIRVDNSRLNARPRKASLGIAVENLVQPLRIVLDSQFKLDPNLNFFTTKGPKLWVGTSPVAASKLKKTFPSECKTIILPKNKKRVHLGKLMEYLAAKGINELMVESGPTLASSFFDEKLVDEFILYISPCIMGTKTMPMVKYKINSMRESYKFSISDKKMFGEDIRLILHPNAS